ncbi:hypothetical protein C8R43DRAFT_974554 [Mycena crocata]|nr:hypothetical protein C8R43DRAFT_974554 [Mycena crocata]
MCSFRPSLLCFAVRLLAPDFFLSFFSASADPLTQTNSVSSFQGAALRFLPKLLQSTLCSTRRSHSVESVHMSEIRSFKG